MKKILSILLLLSLVVCSFTACGGDKDNSTSKVESAADSGDSSNEGTSSDSDVVSPGADIKYADLEKKDLKGREFNIIERWFGYGKSTIDFTGDVLYMEEENGTLTNVNQAKKDIIEQIENDYKCSIDGEIFGEGATDIVQDLKTKILTDLTTGTGIYDFFFESYYYYTGLISDNQLKDIKTIPTINLASSCWDQNAVSELTICDALYFVLGDINTYDNDGTVAMLFNKELYEKLGYEEDLYQLVKDHEWTFDRLKALSAEKPATAEIDGDTSEISEFDQWFMGSETGNLYIHVVAAGEAICAKDKNDEPQLTMMNEQGIQALTDAVEFYLGGQVLVANLQKFYDKYPGPGEAYEKTVTNAFLEGRELFYMSTLIHIPYFRQMNDEFGILPVPMYSESQDNYYSAMSAHTSSVLMIPNGVNAAGSAGEDLGLIIQALAELSQELLTPEYYDKQLKFRDFKDEESSDMLDIIFNNRHYDLGTIFGQTWNNVDTLYNELNTDIVSRFQKVQDVVSELISDTMDDIKG